MTTKETNLEKKDLTSTLTQTPIPTPTPTPTPSSAPSPTPLNSTSIASPKVLFNMDNTWSTMNSSLRSNNRSSQQHRYHKLQKMMSSFKYDLLITFVLIVLDIVCLIGEIVTEGMKKKGEHRGSAHDINRICHWVSFVIVLAFAGESALLLILFGFRTNIGKFKFWFDIAIVWITLAMETTNICVKMATPKESVARWLLSANRFVGIFLILWKLIRIKHAILHVVHICIDCRRRPRAWFSYGSKSTRSNLRDNFSSCNCNSKNNNSYTISRTVTTTAATK